MRPSFSVILFTTASGAGYGLLVLIGLLGPAGFVPASPAFGAAALAAALALVTVGLVSSTFHLGHRNRAWMAFSQWRTSWLSREGWAAIAVYPAAGMFGWGWIFGDGPEWPAGIVAATLATATVISTAMIYRTLPTIIQWCNGWVLPSYLALAAYSGSVWLLALAAAFAADRGALALLAVALGALAGALKTGYWRFVDTRRHPATAASAIGGRGTVRQTQAPHTAENYVLREMGFRVARQHARTLRRIALLTGFALPVALGLAASALEPLAAATTTFGAIGSLTLGLVVERWLFFAEARHVVTLYYGAERA